MSVRRLPRHPSAKAFILLGLVLGMCNSMLMQTLLSTALPAISNDLGSTSLYSWVYSGYILASSVTIPLFGRLCDRFGHKRNYLAGGTLFLLGTLWCSLSPSMPALVLARVTMGVGAGIVVPATYGIIGSLFDKQELRRVFALFAVVQIASTGAGSVLGGFLSSGIGWRLGIGTLLVPEAVAALLVGRLLPRSLQGAGQSRISLTSALSLTAGILLLILGIDSFEQAGRGQAGQAGGPRYGPVPLSLLGAGMLLLTLFLAGEKRTDRGLLPSEFRTSPLLRNLSLQVFLMGALLNVCLVYIPGCLQMEGLLSAQDTGAAMLIYAAAVGAGSIVGGAAKAMPAVRIIGTGWLALLLGACAFLVPLPFTVRLPASLLLVGLGCGLLSAVLLGHIAAQAERNKAGVSSFCHMIRNFGGSIAVAGFGLTLSTGVVSLFAGLAGLSGAGLLLWCWQNHKDNRRPVPPKKKGGRFHESESDRAF
jgi:MFS family permease